MGVNAEGNDSNHRIVATNNFWGTAAAPVQDVDFAGEVLANPFLAQGPDVDGDGATLCGDLCPGTLAAQSADVNGCSCQQLNVGNLAACLVVVVDEVVDEIVDLVDLTTGPGFFQPACCGAAGMAMPMMMVGYAVLLAVRRKRRA